MPKRATTTHATATDLLIEVGVEEMPVGTIIGLAEQLAAITAQLLDDARLAHGAIEPFVTPRRCGVLVRALATRQRADVQEVTGPPKQAAYDAQGQPTQACLGFLKRYNAAPDVLRIKETPRGPYVYLQQTLPSLPTAQALRTLIPDWLAKLPLPKTMRWHDGEDRAFIRPIRWLVVLYGTAIVPVRAAGVTAGRVTRTHRTAGSKPLRIPSAAQYHTLMHRAGVLVDPTARRAAVQRAIESQLTAGERLAPECLSEGHAGGTSLVDEVAHLTEAPAAFRGTCQSRFAELPRDILIASMAKYQRVFAVEDKQGKLLPAFIAVTNGRLRNPAAVRHVYETILAARLADSLLFYQQDLRTPLEQLVPQTKGILVHRQLGSMEQKAERLQQLAKQLAELWGCDADTQRAAVAAARLCKADLVTHVVYEFPSLQGIMGGLYHRRHHPSEQIVAEAIQDQYLTLRVMPRHPAGQVLALADRLDTLTGFLGVGIKPTGSADPFGLRRAANGLLDLLLHDTNRRLPLTKAVALSMDVWGSAIRWSDRTRQHNDILQYLRERLEARQLGRYDVVRAVLAAAFDDAADAVARVNALQSAITKHPQLFAQACKVSERTRNIVRSIKGTPPTQVNESALTEPLEQELWAAITRARPSLDAAIAAHRYTEALTLYAQTFSALLERFFTDVLVNAPDPAVRANRLALLVQVDELISRRVADLTQVVLESPPMSSPTKETVSA